MNPDPIDLLERQHTALQALEDDEFVLHLPLLIDLVRQHARLAGHAEDLCAEAQQHLETFRVYDREAVELLGKLRKRAVKICPQIDDSDAKPADGDHYDPDFQETFAYFDRLCSKENSVDGFPEAPSKADDPSIAGRLIGLLRRKIQESSVRKTLTTECREAMAIEDKHTIEFARYLYISRTHAGVAFLRLRNAAALVRCGPQEDLFLQWKGVSPLFLRKLLPQTSVLFGTKSENRSLATAAADLRLQTRCFVNGLALRYGSALSARAVLNRFKTRSEWHDSARLLEIGGTERKQEVTLTAELARYLFDAGLNPFTEAMLGGLKPDVLDVSLGRRLYVEAKQYDELGSARLDYLRHGMAQVWDTLGRARGSAYEIHEGFYVVFRRGGPRLILPPEVRSEGVTIYPLLIDIAPRNQSGSKQKNQPVSLSIEELLPKPGEKSAKRAREASAGVKSGRSIGAQANDLGHKRQIAKRAK